MAVLVKDSRARSPYWYCCYTAADGRRLKKSTKQSEKKKALEVALALERAEGMAVKGLLTEIRTRDLLSEVLERTTGDVLPFFSAEGWLRDWLRGKEVAKSQGTSTKYSHTIEAFLVHLGERAKLNIAVVTPKDVATFRDAEIASGKNPNTVRYTLKQLAIPFNAACRQGILTHNPTAPVELPGKMKSKDGEETAKTAFTVDQVTALIKAAATEEKGKPIFEAGRDWQGAILFAYYTGARLQDVANMTWSSIDLPETRLTFRARKTGRLVTLPISDELEAYLLKRASTDSGEEFLFPKLAGKGTGGRSGLSMTFSRIMARASIKGEVLRLAEKGTKGRTVRSLTFHSLRHSFNSEMAKAGVVQEVRMDMAGQLSKETNDIYTHTDLVPHRKAVEKLPMVWKHD